MTPIFEHGGESERLLANSLADREDWKLQLEIDTRCDWFLFYPQSDLHWRDIRFAFQCARELERRQIERGKQV